MVGERVTLWQYVPGVYPRDTLGRLWQMVEADGETKRLFHETFWGSSPMSIDPRMDLGAFCRFFDESTGRLLTLVETTEGELAGFFWLDSIVPNWRAGVSVFMRKSVRGSAAFEAGMLFREYATRFLGFRSLWAETPWANVATFARRLGFKDVATLPDYGLFEGAAHDHFILRYVREDA